MIFVWGMQGILVHSRLPKLKRSMNSSIFALVILFLIPHLLISQLYIARPMTLLAKKSQEATAKCATSMNALTTCADTAILYDAQDFLLDRFEENSMNLRKTNMKIRQRNACNSALLPMMGMGGYLQFCLLEAFGFQQGI